MKNIIIIILTSLALFSFTVGLTNQKLKDNPNMVFRITSDKPDEKITFKAAYIFGVEKPELKIADMSTPVTLYGFSSDKHVTAIFQKTLGNGHLVIDLLSPEDLEKENKEKEMGEEEKDESNRYLGGVGSLIIFTTIALKDSVTYSVYVRDY